MKSSNTSKRLKELMKERHLRQIDILNLTKPYCKQYNVKMNKSDISQYVSGKVEPNQEKLAMLGMALSVNEAWLMGFDCLKERLSGNTKEWEKLANSTKSISEMSILADAYELYLNSGYNLTQHEQKVIAAYRKQTDMQPAVDKLLGVSSEIQPEPQLLAAHNDDNEETQQELMNKDIERIKNMRKK